MQVIKDNPEIKKLMQEKAAGVMPAARVPMTPELKERFMQKAQIEMGDSKDYDYEIQGHQHIFALPKDRFIRHQPLDVIMQDMVFIIYGGQDLDIGQFIWEYREIPGKHNIYIFTILSFLE